jgi:hypothetical protein
MTVERTEADSEKTGLIKRVQAPLPPYAQQDPPPAPPAATAGSDAPTQTLADAMIEVSRPPLAAAGPLMVVEAPPAEVATAPAPSASAPTTTAAVMPPPAAEFLTCPECGTTAQVTLNRRDSIDFCRNCDYPLFWTPSKVFRDPSAENAESLRRLPGTVGRATVASLACPFCYEPNALSAQTCVRCGRPMHPVAEAPAPAPVYVPPPPAPLPEPESKVAWWVWALLALGAAALIALVVLIATHTIG